MSVAKIERVRGTSDVLPADYEIRQQIEITLARCFEASGYRPVDVPVLEHTDLHLRKSGPDIVSRLYDFTHHNRRLCLRPEMTASVVRAYVDQLQEAPLPLRLYYAGPVFRYEKPQRGRYRQFTHMGIELIGAAGTLADAEVIQLAWQGLRNLGLQHHSLSLGHIGILAAFLESLSLDPRLRSFLLTRMEDLKKHGKQHILERVREIYASLHGLSAPASSTEQPAHTDTADSATLPSTLPDLLRGTDSATTQTAVKNLFEAMNIQLDATRQPGSADRESSEIIDRLLAKTSRRDQTARVEQALDFMLELGALSGDPAEVLPAIEALLERYGIDNTPLQQLRAIVQTLGYYHIPAGAVRLDPGLSRGLHYYTGMIFEIYHGTGNDVLQIGGGGRYDDLVAVLGGRKDTPATGFSYGVERLRLALESETGLPESVSHPADVLVIPVGSEDQGYAIGLAEQLRGAGLRAELDIRSRTIANNIQYATRRAIPLIAVVGPDERASQEVFLKNLHTREERHVPLHSASSHIEELR